MKNIAVCIPTLNSEKYLETCLNSVSKLKNINVFIVDGGSKDKTAEIAAKYNVRLVKQKGIGLAAARNTAIEHADSHLLLFLDSDCAINKNWLEKTLKHFNDKKIAGVCGRAIEYNRRKLPDKWRAFHLRQDWGDKAAINPPFLYGSNSIFRLSALKEVSGYDEKYISNYEDVDISRRIYGLGLNLVYDPGAICHHIRRDNLASVLLAARQWTFFSYPTPTNLKKLFLRIFIYNPHLFMAYLFLEIKKFRIGLIPVSFFSLLFNQFFDMQYYAKKIKEKS